MKLGPTFCFRGFENEAYYLLQRDRSRYADYAGTGNSLNANHPIVRRMIVDSLRYWVTHMHVDGFRFDLASVLARDENGTPLLNPPIIWDIETDPAWPDKGYRGGLGCRGAVSGRELCRRQLAGMERQVPRRCSTISQGRSRNGVESSGPVAGKP